MNHVIVAFFVGVVAGSIGMQWQVQRVSEQDPISVQPERRTTEAPSALPARRTMPNAERVTMSASPRTASSPIVDSATSATPEPTPATVAAVPISEAVEPLLATPYNGSTLRDIHAQLENEQEDVTWSYAIEQELVEFFGTPRDSMTFDVRSIECRATLCEVQALALGSTQNMTVMEDLQQQPWWDFDRSVAEIGEHAGNKTMLLYLMRKS